MIVFVMSDDHQYTVRAVLETRDHPLQGRTILLSHAEFLALPRLPVGDYVFVDLERLDPAALDAAAARAARLRAALPALRALNAPDRRLGRLAVMGRLHAAGINGFRVLPAEPRPADLRHPVFLRRLDDHEGPKSALLPDAAALAAALAASAAAGVPPAALAVTEYVDARNEEGLHEKRSYFRIGATLFPSALDVSRNWVCKGVMGDPDAVEAEARERAFLDGDADAAALAAAFDVAGIGYGRADYAIVDGRPQLFEINTNPLIERPETMPPGQRAYAERLVARWLAGLVAFSPPDRAPARWIDVPGAAPAGAGAPRGHRLRRLVRGTLGAAGQLHRETAVMRPLRALGIAR